MWRCHSSAGANCSVPSTLADGDPLQRGSEVKYVCMYVFVYMNISIYIYSRCMHIHLYIYMYTHMDVPMRFCRYLHKYTCISNYVHARSRAYLSMFPPPSYDRSQPPRPLASRSTFPLSRLRQRRDRCSGVRQSCFKVQAGQGAPQTISAMPPQGAVFAAPAAAAGGSES